MLRNCLLTLGFAAHSAVPVAACGLSTEELKLSLIGDWQVTNGFGTLAMSGRVMPLPSGNSASASVIPTETGLAVTGGAAPGTYDAHFVEDARFVLDAPSRTILEQGEAWFGEKAEIITDEELNLLARCAEGQMLPQLHIAGRFQDPEGTVDFNVYLFVLSETSMYGIMSGDLLSIGGTAKRVTHWTR
ncbi:hypothetical protein PhaeoP83_04129 (plasmid) [Phaeobacter inhibens]|uniref:Uncharacterized protein n=1 Tax=Phaeobacter inhibens TaxID=221822 RepID=A0ABN5GVW5_9RHOB|nr:hypothetical protein [Phaeobacter inhibens]AUQ52347.1 hypothetical protein PhaeoP83_04129 [Phaeobacter inhibens]AUQ96952.1 hypothetical protein PhaeoP66_04226 [Phaeobacter inhibens]AUR22152.1 hypothetical protein PhaeoP80_04129 [Phaeobacter inhibens]UWR83253.1 hypothetical protein K4L05_10910 [Phaeobacter inhibens]UWR92651.1 hypothetical protein K4K96_00910 [Phaeobacter inhibens]